MLHFCFLTITSLLVRCIKSNTNTPMCIIHLYNQSPKGKMHKLFLFSCAPIFTGHRIKKILIGLVYVFLKKKKSRNKTQKHGTSKIYFRKNSFIKLFKKKPYSYSQNVIQSPKLIYMFHPQSLIHVNGEQINVKWLMD